MTSEQLKKIHQLFVACSSRDPSQFFRAINQLHPMLLTTEVENLAVKLAWHYRNVEAYYFFIARDNPTEVPNWVVQQYKNLDPQWQGYLPKIDLSPALLKPEQVNLIEQRLFTYFKPDITFQIICHALTKADVFEPSYVSLQLLANINFRDLNYWEKIYKFFRQHLSDDFDLRFPGLSEIMTEAIHEIFTHHLRDLHLWTPMLSKIMMDPSKVQEGQKLLALLQKNPHLTQQEFRKLPWQTWVALKIQTQLPSLPEIQFLNWMQIRIAKPAKEFMDKEWLKQLVAVKLSHHSVHLQPDDKVKLLRLLGGYSRDQYERLEILPLISMQVVNVDWATEQRRLPQRTPTLKAVSQWLKRLKLLADDFKVMVGPRISTGRAVIVFNPANLGTPAENIYQFLSTQERRYFDWYLRGFLNVEQNKQLKEVGALEFEAANQVLIEMQGKWISLVSEINNSLNFYRIYRPHFMIAEVLIPLLIGVGGIMILASLDEIGYGYIIFGILGLIVPLVYSIFIMIRMDVAKDLPLNWFASRMVTEPDCAEAALNNLVKLSQMKEDLTLIYQHLQFTNPLLSQSLIDLLAGLNSILLDTIITPLNNRIDDHAKVKEDDVGQYRKDFLPTQQPTKLLKNMLTTTQTSSLFWDIRIDKNKQLKLADIRPVLVKYGLSDIRPNALLPGNPPKLPDTDPDAIYQIRSEINAHI